MYSGIYSSFRDAAVLQGAQQVQAEQRETCRWFDGHYPSWKHTSAVSKIRVAST